LRKEGADGYQDIQYHIYDMVVPFGFNQRLSFLDQLLPKDVKHLRRVPTAILNNRAEIDAQHDDYVSQGYEGLMIRIGNTPYEEGHRSDQLLKFKRWRESEFKVIDLKEGRGRLQGCAICVCEIILPSGEKAEFSAKMEGESTHLRAAWENPELWIGKMMTVKYQGLTKTGKPRFPTGLRLREDL
jgi:DNA ligase-1